MAHSVQMKTNVLSVLWSNVAFLELSGVAVLFAKRLFWCTGLSDPQDRVQPVNTNQAGMLHSHERLSGTEHHAFVRVNPRCLLKETVVL